MDKKKMTSNSVEILIIFAICVLGEILHVIIPIPISSGVYGMIIMFILLYFKVIKINQVEDVGNWLVKNMMIMFLPISVGLIDMISEIKSMILPIILSFSVVTILVMLVTGKVVQGMTKISKSKNKKANEEEDKVLCLKA